MQRKTGEKTHTESATLYAERHKNIVPLMGIPSGGGWRATGGKESGSGMLQNKEMWKFSSTSGLKGPTLHSTINGTKYTQIDYKN